MLVLHDAAIHVHYGFIYLAGEDEEIGELLMEERLGQRNGLCGAQVPGRISMLTGLHTGSVPLRIECHSDEPPLDDEWEDVVEVSFAVDDPYLTLSSFDDHVPLNLPGDGSYRVRYSATGMDAGRSLDTALDEPAPDRYLLQLWPASMAPDAIVRQTSQAATYWHDVAAGHA